MSATQDLLSNYQHVIDDLVLVTGSRGVFDVEITEGDSAATIYSKGETGRHANEGEVLALFTEHVGPSIARYGT